jgi:hypothetical protein
MKRKAFCLSQDVVSASDRITITAEMALIERLPIAPWQFEERSSVTVPRSVEYLANTV